MKHLEAIAELDAIRGEVSQATDRIFDAVESAMAKLQLARAGDVQATVDAEAVLCDVIEALGFQDITGQRLSRVAALLGECSPQVAAKTPHSEVSLENGPALPGEGLSQDDADSLFASFG